MDAPRPDSSNELPTGRVWLIDGYNLLHASLSGRDRSEWWTAAQRAKLLERVETFSGPAEELWVVFDGKRPTEIPEDQRLRCVYAPSADEWIRVAVRDAIDVTEVVVVTGDRPVADRARHRGATIVSPRSFLRHCSGD